MSTHRWLDWTCLSCGHDQTTVFAVDSFVFVFPCSRCRALHVAEQALNEKDQPRLRPDLPIGPNGAPLILGPKLYASCTQPVPVEHVELTPEEKDAPP